MAVLASALVPSRGPVVTRVGARRRRPPAPPATTPRVLPANNNPLSRRRPKRRAPVSRRQRARARRARAHIYPHTRGDAALEEVAASTATGEDRVDVGAPARIASSVGRADAAREGAPLVRQDRLTSASPGPQHGRRGDAAAGPLLVVGVVAAPRRRRGRSRRRRPATRAPRAVPRSTLSRRPARRAWIGPGRVARSSRPRSGDAGGLSFGRPNATSGGSGGLSARRCRPHAAPRVAAARRASRPPPSYTARRSASLASAT